MTKHINTTIHIKARPEKIWNILTNFENYGTWNPFIKSVKEEVKVGGKISVKIQEMNFKPTVLAFKENTELRWLGHLLFKGLFDGEHKFLLIDNGDGTTTFEQSETFKGILVGLFSKDLANKTKPGFESMNEKLKELAENS